ncbi:MAG: aminopeptidase P family N-terminal domain-containing protein [Rubrivivax sp.]
MDTRTSPFRERITQLREALAREGVAALLVPSADPHLSEYLPERWQGRQWLSGFTGSMGTLVVGQKAAALFADSRYWEQAERELEGSGIDLVRIASAAAPAHLDWIALQVPRGGTVAVDGQVLGLAAAQALAARLEAAGLVLDTGRDLLGAVWPARPALPAAPVYEHRPPHAVRTRASNLAAVREAMARHCATHHFVSTVDDIAWMLNLRGSDVEYNPVLRAPAVRRARRPPSSSARARWVRPNAPRSPPTASCSRLTPKPATRWPRSASVTRLSTPSA